ncbi:MAG: transcriptional repressor [Alphaproteobacteria bacterium]|nr:transcriptional repressor [Alphaproteobacteria bacterium]
MKGKERHGAPPATRHAQDPAHGHAHDHARCLEDAQVAASRLAAEAGLRLTPLRRQVLNIVAESHRPLGAYDILERLAEDRARQGERAAPPTVYRALEFLMDAGLVHRIDSKNAYVACFKPGATHASYFLLCEVCGTAAELEDEGLAGALRAASAARGFAPRQAVVEILGTCRDCQIAPASQGRKPLA